MIYVELSPLLCTVFQNGLDASYLAYLVQYFSLLIVLEASSTKTNTHVTTLINKDPMFNQNIAFIMIFLA